MKFRITPLNIVTALAFALLVVSIIDTKPSGPAQHIDVGSIYKLILGSLILVTFVTDLIFRFTLKNLKRIWIVEMLFIGIATIMMLILQK